MNYTCSKCGKEFNPTLIPKYGEKLLCFKCRPKTTTVEFFKEATDEVAKYNAEIRKPLEEEIERLNKIIAVVQRELPQSQEFEVNGVKFSIEQCMVLRQFNIVHDASIKNERKKERQKVITELEEWIESAEIRTTEQETWDALQELKQKLNDMKGEK